MALGALAGFLTYAFDIERLSGVDSGAELGEFDRGRHNIASFPGIIQRDTQDRIVEPHSGSLQRLSFEVADLWLGSEANYFKIIGASQWFFPLPRETVGAVSFQGGIADRMERRERCRFPAGFSSEGRPPFAAMTMNGSARRGQMGPRPVGISSSWPILSGAFPSIEALGSCCCPMLATCFALLMTFDPGKSRGPWGWGCAIARRLDRFVSITGASWIRRGTKPPGASTSPSARPSELRSSYGIRTHTCSGEWEPGKPSTRPSRP